jgi:hypothetical protein
MRELSSSRDIRAVRGTLTMQQKIDIDKLWTEFWTGGITHPLTIIEQIAKDLDELEAML